MTEQNYRKDIRNFAIVAHIDHGKTTLVDTMLRQSGIFRDHEAVTDRVMDSEDQERERGITILAKNTAIHYRDTKFNILDTPGHADFGGEVERVLTLADGVLLLVDAAEGPLPQTRFVLSKAAAAKLKPIVVINKMDRQDARPDEVLDEIYDLFIDLGIEEDALDFPVVYAIGREGIAYEDKDKASTTLEPLFEAIMRHLPAPPDRSEEPLRILVANTEYDEYVGRIAIGRVVSGCVKQSQNIFVHGEEGEPKPAKVMRLYSFEGLGRAEVKDAQSGDIVAIAGVEGVNIGDTLIDAADVTPLERIRVDPPTIRMMILVNDSPLAGRDGKYVTSRQLRERLFKASEQNVSIRVSDGASPDQFEIAGRGELQLAVMVEALRREGFELQLSKPQVVTQEVDGVLSEPMELVMIDVPEEFIGIVTEKMSPRKAKMLKMMPTGGGRIRMEFRIPSRGLIGYRSEFLTDTRGTGILSSLVDGWSPYLGPMARRPNGAIVSDRSGHTTAYAIFNLQARGRMFVGPGVEVYEGMIVGGNSRESDLDVFICREKKLTNIRAAGKDDALILTPPKQMSLEQAIEYIDEDELIEVTPNAIRLRKRQLACNLRPKRVANREEEG